MKKGTLRLVCTHCYDAEDGFDIFYDKNADKYVVKCKCCDTVIATINGYAFSMDGEEQDAETSA